MGNDVVIYQSGDGFVKMEPIVDASNETILATQKVMAQLFGVTVAISLIILREYFQVGSWPLKC